MTAVFTRFVFCLGFWQLLFVPYGAECKSDSQNASAVSLLQQPRSFGESKLTKVPIANLLQQQVFNNSSNVERSLSSTVAAASATDDNDEVATLKSLSKSKSAARVHDEEIERPRVDTTARTDRSSSRGRQRFQPLDNAITESTKLKPQLQQEPTVVNDTTDAATQAIVTNAGAATTEGDKNTTTNRTGKSSNFRVGGDGYVFEKTYDFDAITESSPSSFHKHRENSEEYAYEPLVVGGRESENNIDRIRNYNDNNGNVRIANIVKKPQGFTLTTETPLIDGYRRPSTSSSVLSANHLATKKRITNSVVSDSASVISLTRPGPAVSFSSPSSTENNPTSISKNEIARKPSVKPTFSSRRRPGNPGEKNENSLPTTSAVWALAALKTPTNFKVAKRPSGVEMVRKPSIDTKIGVMPPTTIKPFVSWSTRLQKTTTEDALDATTTFRTSLEVDAETISPIALLGSKLMNQTDVREPITSSTAPHPEKVLNDSTTLKDQLAATVNTRTNLVAENVTSIPPVVIATAVTEEDIRIDLMENIDSNTAYKEMIKQHSNRSADHISATTNETRPSSKVNEEPAQPEKTEESDNNMKPAYNLMTDILVNNSSSAIVNTEDVETFTVTSSSTEVSSATPNLNVNNSLVADTSSTEAVELTPVNNAANRTNTATDESFFPISSPVLENAESNVIFDQPYSSGNKKNQIDVNTIVEKMENAPLTPARNLTEEKQRASSLEDTVVVISNNNNSVIVDENRTLPSNAVVIPIFSGENEQSRSRWNLTSASNATEVTGVEDQLRTIDDRTPSIAFSPAELTSSTLPSLPSTILKISTASSDEEQPLITTMRIFHTKPQQPSTSINTVTQAASTIANSTSLMTSMELSTPSSSSQETPRSQTPMRPITWSSNEELSTDFVTTLLPSPSSTASTIPAISTSKKYPDINTDDEEDEGPVYTTLTNDIHQQSTESVEISSASPSSAEEAAPTTSSTATFSSTSGPTIAADTLPVVPFKPNLPPENVPGYLMLFLKSSFADICQPSSALRENLFQYITQRSLRVQSKEQVVMVIDPEHCKDPDHLMRIIPVALYLVDDFGSYDKTLIDEMKKLLEEESLNSAPLPIHQIVYYENIAPDNSRVIAAMVITSIAAICFVLLIFLMCTIRNRQKSNYGQRCTPVSSDDYNLDNISEYASIRRKSMMRASKRSYGNLAFDDPTGPTKTLTYNGLLKACESRCSLDEEFSQIPVVTVKPDELPPGAEVKNRYANVIPLPETRVSLSFTNPCSDSVNDYINANYVKGFKDADRFYIACQAPLSNTIEDFWKMVWKEQTKVIIMLTGLTENGVEKCADYLPPSEVLDCHRLFGDYQITLKKREVKEKYVISSLQLKNMENNLWREVHHLWYTNWPAQGVPNEQSSIIAFLIEARAFMRNSSGPHVVHCCPGTGRTGTVIAIDICIRDYEMSRSVDIPATVAKLRRCRAGAVQTKEQYAFIYKVLSLYARKLHGGTSLDSI